MNKIKDFFLYTLNFWKVKDFYLNLKWFIKNLFLFRNELWNWRPWDYRYQELLFAFGLEQVKLSIQNGLEIRQSADKKITALTELIYQLRRDITDEAYFNPSQDSLEEYNKNYNELRANKINRIAQLIKGQDPIVFINKTTEEYLELFDGSGSDGWWD